MPKYPTTKLKTIDYDSPSGKINIAKWVPPFQKVANGFGFVGVLAEDTKSGKLQCGICGKWYEMLTTHIYAKHKLTSKEYAEKFNLSRNTALRSMYIRKRQSEVMLGMRLKHKKFRMKFKKGNNESANRKNKPKSIETQNKHGVCDLQILEKISSLKNKLGRTPALTELIDKYGTGFAALLHIRYQGYLNFLKKQNWTPVTSNYYPKYTKEYFINKGVKSIKDGKELIGSRVFTLNEIRALYRVFPSQKVGEMQ